MKYDDNCARYNYCNIPDCSAGACKHYESLQIIKYSKPTINSKKGGKVNNLTTAYLWTMFIFGIMDTIHTFIWTSQTHPRTPDTVTDKEDTIMSCVSLALTLWVGIILFG